MDKTLQMIVVAALIMMVAAIVLFLVTGQSGKIGDIVDNRTSSATCTGLKTQYANACNCNADGSNQETGKASEFYTRAQDKDCAWASTSYECKDNVCS